MSLVNDYFNRFLPRKSGVPLLPGYDSYSMTFVIAFRDTGRRWVLRVEGGAMTSIMEEDNPDAPVRFVVDEPIFAEIVRGQISPQKAFFSRKTDIKGNLVAGMKLAKILALFFAHHPYDDEPRTAHAE